MFGRYNHHFINRHVQCPCITSRLVTQITILNSDDWKRTQRNLPRIYLFWQENVLSSFCGDWNVRLEEYSNPLSGQMVFTIVCSPACYRRISPVHVQSNMESECTCPFLARSKPGRDHLQLITGESLSTCCVWSMWLTFSTCGTRRVKTSSVMPPV